MVAKYLLDTNVLIYLMLNDYRLGTGAQELLDGELDRCVVSVASLWEVAIKQRVRKLHLPAELEEVLDELRVPILPIETKHVASYKALPESKHADPFDLLLMAQAVAEGLILLTTDQTILKATVSGLAMVNCRV